MLALAVALGVPLTYGLNTLWLQNFPNRVPFGAGTLGLGTGILLVLGLLTIASQTLRAARSKPLDSLRTE
jgi:putative ABC transport system permease protein